MAIVLATLAGVNAPPVDAAPCEDIEVAAPFNPPQPNLFFSTRDLANLSIKEQLLSDGSSVYGAAFFKGFFGTVRTNRTVVGASFDENKRIPKAVWFDLEGDL